MRAGKARLARVGRLLTGSVLFACVYPLLWRTPFSRRSLADSLTVAGLALLVLGLFRLVKHMRVFDSTKYGWKKLIEVIRTRDYAPAQSLLPSLADYKRTHPYKKEAVPCLAAAVLDLAAAGVLLL